MGEMMEYRHLIDNPKYRDIWIHGYGNELGILTKVLKVRVEGTNTVFFIVKEDLPAARWKDVTYGRICCNFRPKKQYPHSVRLTMGGDRINYPDDCGTPTAGMLTLKLLLNSVISTKGEKFMTVNIKYFYLNTPMKWYKYMRLKLAELPEGFVSILRTS